MAVIKNEEQYGVILSLFASTIWILFPFYWRELDHVGPIEILCHRIVWIVPICLLMLYVQKTLGQLKLAFSSMRVILLLLFSTVMISLNWGTYIWAVANDEILQASLGYFVTPLANVLAGQVVFKEKLRKWQWVSVGLACFGVVFSMLYAGVFPYLGIMMAISFGIYGTIRKLVPVDSVPGLCVETILMIPMAIGYLFWLHDSGALSFGHVDIYTDLLLIGAGIMTMVPLVAYVAATKRLPISTIGLLTYVVPSGLFVMAVAVFDEPVTFGDIVTFGFIWTGLIIFSLDRRHEARRNRGLGI